MAKLALVERFRKAVLLATLAKGSNVELAHADAFTLLIRLEALEKAGGLVVAQFDGIANDKWATKGMEESIETLRGVLEIKDE